MMMSSIDLFFSRDWAGGGGPAADTPRFTFAAPEPSAVAVVAGCFEACGFSDGAADFAKLPNKLEVGAGADVDAVDVLVASEVVTGALACVFPRFGNRLLDGALVEGADVPELLAGLLKKLKALGAAVDDATELVAGG